MLDDNHHLGDITDINTHPHLCQTSSGGDGASVLAPVVSFLFVVQRGKMRPSFYLCNAVRPLDLQSFLVFLLV